MNISMDLTEEELFNEIEDKISLSDLKYVLDSEFNIGYADIDDFIVTQESRQYLDQIKMLFRESSSKLEIITNTPFNINIGKIFKDRNIQIYFCKKSDIDKKFALELNDDFKKTESIMVENTVENILNTGFRNKSSDIHLEIYENKSRIRYRIDGRLIEKYSFNKDDYNKVNNIIKMMAKMDISNKLLPQDGHFNWTYNDKVYDIRVSTMPTISGEKIVLRLLSDEFLYSGMEDLGMDRSIVDRVTSIIYKTNGMLILTGPTGSGKTTTMYSILKEMDFKQKNIVTIEDPIEYKVNGINQIQINNKAGLSFSNGLRAILRQDPDIIMIGEIRDTETARLAIRSSITGHLVLSTLHTNTTHSAVVRLLDLGIENYLISDGVTSVISQRLIRKLCNNCKKSYYTDECINKRLGFKFKQKIYKAVGCNQCNAGYIGRIGVYEILDINRYLVKEILMGKNIEDIRRKDIYEGFQSMDNNLRRLLLEGIVSYEDVITIGF